MPSNLLYQLNVAIEGPYNNVEIPKHSDKLMNLFVLNTGDDRFLERTKIIVKAQKGFDSTDIRSFDFLGGFLTIPLFSERFVEEVGESLRDDLKFYPCEVQTLHGNVAFYMGKCLNYYDILNQEASGYYTMSDGERVIDDPVFKKAGFPDFLISRDRSNKLHMAVSQGFRELKEAHGLNMDLRPTPQE